MRNIVIADSQGFCWGVRKALDKVSEFDKVSILGDLIHNKQVVNKLAANGKKVIRDVTENAGNPIVITAHGTVVSNFEKLEKLNIEVVNTTCPLVSVIYTKGKKLEKEGRKIVIIGDKNHIEVKGIASRMDGPIIINSEDDILKIDFPKEVGIVCQSTYSIHKFKLLVNLIKSKVKDVKTRNTICSPTVKRQIAAEELAQQVELMIVIGGSHSSNTKKLAELSKEYVNTYHIETSDQLDKAWFEDKMEIGITAGASTPDWVIEEVREKILNFPVK